MGKEIREGELGWAALFGTALMLGFLALTGVLVGRYIGGRFFGREEIGIIVGVVLGMAIGFYDIIRVATRVMKRADRIALEQREERERAEAEEQAKIEVGETGDNNEIEKEHTGEETEEDNDDIIIM